ncbi:MAG TPA: 50S ribosomal protein P1 [Nitrososphaeraceae archaeon]|jgi:large subunit ribosomal protein L12
MEYVYAALLLHKLKQEITEDNVKNVIKATGATPDDVRIKALVAALSEVNIEEALKATPPTASSVAPPIAGGGSATTGAPKEEEKKEKKEEEALEGLSALFG